MKLHRLQSKPKQKYILAPREAEHKKKTNENESPKIRPLRVGKNLIYLDTKAPVDF